MKKKFQLIIILKNNQYARLVENLFVFYGEMLDERKLERSVREIRSCDLLVVVGSSLVVYPAAGLVRYKPKDAKLVIINFDPTPYESFADLVINDDISAVFSAV